MKGHARPRGDRWELRVYLGRDALTKKKRYATRTVDAAGKREAETQLASFVSELAGGHTIKPGTFGELAERWFRIAAPRWEPNTIKNTRQYLDGYLQALYELPVDRIRTDHLDAFYDALGERGGKDGGELAPATVQRVHHVVRRALEQAVTWGWVRSNPASRATLPPLPDSDTEGPAPADVVRLLDAAEAKDPDLHLFLVLAAVTGARRGEISALRWSDFDAGQVSIARTIAVGPDGPVERSKRTRNKGKPRPVALDAGTSALVARHRTRCAEDALALGVALPSDAFVFPITPAGDAPTSPGTWTRRFARLRDDCKLAHIRLHDLRHFVATTLLDAGVPLPTVAERLGHAGGGRTTVAIYGHGRRATDEAAANLLAGLLRSEPTEPGATG